MESQDLEYETSSDDSVSDVESSSARRKTRQKRYNWAKMRTFPDKTTALAYIKIQKLRWKRLAYDTDEGERIMFDCRHSRKCAAKIYLLCNSTTQDCTLYKTDKAHNHIRKSVGISPKLKEKIDELYRTGITKPKLILKNIADSGLKEPKAQKLNNYLRTLRVRVLGAPVVSLGDIARLCQLNSKLPLDEDEAFVLSYELEDNDPMHFRIFLTTKRLLQLRERSTVLHVDATYKLIWQGFPVLVFSTSDKNRSFHPFGMAICSSEKEEDFSFVFKTLRDGILDQEIPFVPSVLVADCALAITNACNTVFQNTVLRVHCWYHVITSIRKKLKTFSVRTVIDELEEDIVSLQLAKSQSEFDAAKLLFLKKWRLETQTKDFLLYFQVEYLEQNTGWFEGRALGAPSTNNCLEVTNRSIKDEGMLRQRLELGHFFEAAKSLLTQMSRTRNPDTVNPKVFANVPTLQLKLQTEAFNWTRTKPIIKFRTINGLTHYFVTPNDQPRVKEEDIDNFLKQRAKQNWRTLRTYQKYQSRLWLVIMKENWMDATCTCPDFLKKIYL